MKLLTFVRLLGVAVILNYSHFTLAQITPSNGIVYVKPSTRGSGNGSSWQDATNNLHDAIHAANVEKVFVAVGTYNVGQRSLVMKNNIEIYGGFDPDSGISDLTHKRIFASYQGSAGSILDGGNSGTVINNAFTSGNILDTTAILDGFTIQNGKHINNAGGINNNYASPTLRNLLVKDNVGFYGGGICNLYSSPVISRVTFYNNYAAWYGGGVYSEFSSPVIRDCSFINNTAVVSGGGIDQSRLNLVLTNVLLSGNKTTGTNEYSRLSGGGAISIYNTTNATLTNVTIAGNMTNGRGGGIYIEANSSAAMKNSIVFGNTAGNFHPAIYLPNPAGLTMKNSLVEGYTSTLSGNINTSGFMLQDIFNNPPVGDYTLKENSPAINKGNNSLFAGLDVSAKDLAGNPRVTDYEEDGVIDLGAFESIYGSPLVPDANRIIYVKPLPAGSQDGSSWDNATSNLHNAINIAGVKKVFVAVGTYNVGQSSFLMKNGVEIYGGFDPVSGVTDLTHSRILPTAENTEGSILDGEEVRSVISNAFTVATSLNNTAILDGFTLKNGNGETNGGGIYNVYANPILRNLWITNNKAENGGAIYNSNSSPVITKVTFVNNQASALGGAVYDYSSSPVITNSSFINNTAGSRGGAINHNKSNLVLTNVLLSGNQTSGGDGYGGAVCLFNESTATLTNVTITRNASVTSGGAIFIDNDSHITIQNSIIFGNTATVSGSNILVQGSNLTMQNTLVEGYTGTSSGNINAAGITMEGIFREPSESDFTLKENSPAINKGNNTLFPGLNENSRDLKGYLRVSNYTDGGIIDLGAYESRYDSPINPDHNDIVYVKPSSTGIGDGSSWDNATSELHNVIHATGVKKVFVAVGTYHAGQSSFVMKNGVEIYGGFDPGNDITDLTSPRILPTSGNSEGSVLDGENTRGVISNVFTQNTALNNTAVLDGFTLTRGRYITGGAMYNVYASPTLKNLLVKNNTGTNDGGGMFNFNSSSPILSNVIIENNNANYGAGFFNRNNSSPRMADVVIRNNVAGTDGGGMYNDVDSSPSFIRVSITGNKAGNGAGMYNRTRSSPNLINTLIANNTATNNGSAIRSESNSSSSLTNVTLVNNSSLYGIHSTANSSVSLKNSIIFGSINGTSSVSYTLVQNSSSTLNNNINGIGIVPEDIFLSPQDRNYQLKPVSRVINVGDNASFPNLEVNTKDLAGNPRVTNYLDEGIIDLGAYESSTVNSINPDANRIVYVKPVISGLGDGSSWENAVSDLQKAINATGVDKVFVAVGIYKVGQHSFIMKNGVEIYGGFDPTSGITGLTHSRILPANGNSEGSILDGDKVSPAILNAFTESTALNNSAVIDGFTIKNGKNSAGGGGMYNLYASPILRNLMVKENEAEKGGGIYNESSSPTISNVTFKNNVATNYGGGIYNLAGSPVIMHTYFINNTASNYGGGIASSASNVNITDVLFSGNKASHPYYNGGYGGGLSNSNYSNITLTNVTITNNSAASRGGAVFNGSGSGITIQNSIIFGNSAVEVYPNIYNYDGTYTMQSSLIEGSTNTSSGNINATGLTLQNIFRNPASGDFTLKENSPAINKGDNTLYIGLDENTKDLAGNRRVKNFADEGIIDLGAYESVYDSPLIPDANHTVYVKPIATGTKDGSSWSNATASIQNGIQAPGVQRVFVAVGTYEVGESSFVMKNGVEIYGGFDPALGITDLTHTRILPVHGNSEGSILDGKKIKTVIFNVFTECTPLNGTAVLDGFTVKNGMSSGNGGGIYNKYASPTLKNLLVKDNEARYGGGIFNEYGSPVITHSSFINNKAERTGGAIDNDYSNLTLTNVLFSGNRADDSDGGALSLYYSSNATVTNVTMTGNSGFRGGAINVRENNTITIRNSIIFGNTSTSSNPNLHAVNSITMHNSLVEGYIGTSNGNINATGHTLQTIFKNPTTPDYTLKENSPAINKGDNTFFAGLDENTKDLAGKPRITNYNDGGVVDLGVYESTYDIKITPDAHKIVYVKPVATGSGTGNSWVNATSDLQGAIDALNVQKVFVAIGVYPVPAPRSFVMKSGVEIYGGFIPENGIIDLSHPRTLPQNGNSDGSILDGKNQHPVIWNDNNGLTYSAVLDGFTITKGLSPDYGGGIFNWDVSPTLRNLMIKNNKAEDSGGGIFNSNSNMILSNSVIQDNNAALDGGGIYSQLSSHVLSDVIIKGNTAQKTGGGFSGIQSTVNFSNLVIENNQASYGGGLFLNRNTESVFSNITLKSNTAELAGGGFYSNKSTVNLSKSIIENNSAFYGGGIYNNESSEVIFSNLIVRNNTATGTTTGSGGGGIFNASSDLVITNSLIANNSTYFQGGGFRNLSGNPVLTNVTLVNNSAANHRGTAAMDIPGGMPKVRNSIFYGAINGVYDSQYSLIQNNTEFNNGNLNPDGLVLTDIFTNPSNADYSIKISSPTINSGNNPLFQGLNEDTKDLAGNSRIYDYANNGVIDMGAYEFNGPHLDFSKVVFENKTITYNGSSHSISISGYPASLEPTYEILISSEAASVGNSAINAGVYTVKASFPDFNKVYSATLTIQKADGVITANRIQNYIADGTVKNTVATLNHSETTLIYTPQQGYAEIGNYEVIVSAQETANYFAANDTVSLVIESICLYETPTPPTTVSVYYVCSGSNLTLSGNCTTINSAVKWYADADGVHEINPQLVRVTSQTTYYAACVSNTTPACPSLVVPVSIIVDKPLAFLSNTLFTNVYGCQNNSTILSVDTNLISGSPYLLIWQKFDGTSYADLTEGINYQQVNNDTLILSDLKLAADGSLFRAKIYNNCNTVYSDTFTLKINRLPEITVQAFGQTVCVGNQTTLSIEADGSGLSYQWQVNTGNGFNDILVLNNHYANINTPNLLISDIGHEFNNYSYRCVVFNGCRSIVSEPAVLVIDPTINILSQPASRTVCQGRNVSFTVNAVNTQNGSISYQWQRSVDGGNTYTNVTASAFYSGEDTKTITLSDIQANLNNVRFRCLINGYCQSRGAVLTVTPIATIVSHPQNIEICEGNNGSFAVNANGTGLTYRWQVDTGSGFVNINDGDMHQGARESTLSLFYPSSEANGYRYRCLVSGNSTCDTNADTSSVASLYVGVAAEAQVVVWNSTISEGVGPSQASGYILGRNKVIAPNGKAQYLAGQAIILEPGFEVESGAVFEAEIKNACQLVKGVKELPKEIRK